MINDKKEQNKDNNDRIMCNIKIMTPPSFTFASLKRN